MRHRKRGRRLGRSSSHRQAMLKNLASSLFLTERDAEFDENAPKIKGRVVTTLHKAKEVRPLVEKCITLARNSIEHERRAEEFATSAARQSEDWRQWRNSDQWQQWCEARAPVVAARRRALQLLGDKQAVAVLFDTIAPRFEDRPGGYTRILRLATPRLGDAGARAILELVGEHDRVSQRSEKPAFGDLSDDETGSAGETALPADEAAEPASAADESSLDESAAAETPVDEGPADEDKKS